MVLKLFNTLSRKKEEFVPKGDCVSLYCCGPTVYNYAHIGNLRTFIFEDFLRRVLEYNNYPLKHVMNVTDVGHLTSDADDGEDKMEAGARREGKTVWEIADFYTRAFFEDTASLNILTPHVVSKATDHIQEMIDMISRLEKNGFTYVSEGNVYFDISKFKYYRDLGRLNLESLRSTTRVSDDVGKRNPYDFVLWFTQSKFKDHAMQWDSPWGRGYPGWHIECSAMSTKYLGPQIDIHCGGVDHIQVHHTNEIAQSECAYDVHPFSSYWLHGEFLVIDNNRMGKSEGNFIRLATLKDKGFEPMVYRYFCLTAHYRQKLNFSWEALEHAKNSLTAIQTKVTSLLSEESVSSDAVVSYISRFLQVINDDLNAPQALALLHEVLRSDLSAGEKKTIVLDFDKVFGFGFSELTPLVVVDVTSEFKEALEKREVARKNKDWATADKIRDEIQSKGYVIKDTPEGSVVEKA